MAKLHRIRRHDFGLLQRYVLGPVLPPGGRGIYDTARKWYKVIKAWRKKDPERKAKRGNRCGPRSTHWACHMHYCPMCHARRAWQDFNFLQAYAATTGWDCYVSVRHWPLADPGPVEHLPSREFVQHLVRMYLATVRQHRPPAYVYQIAVTYRRGQWLLIASTVILSRRQIPGWQAIRRRRRARLMAIAKHFRYPAEWLDATLLPYVDGLMYKLRLHAQVVVSRPLKHRVRTLCWAYKWRRKRMSTTFANVFGSLAATQQWDLTLQYELLKIVLNDFSAMDVKRVEEATSELDLPERIRILLNLADMEAKPNAITFLHEFVQLSQAAPATSAPPAAGVPPPTQAILQELSDHIVVDFARRVLANPRVQDLGDVPLTVDNVYAVPVPQHQVEYLESRFSQGIPEADVGEHGEVIAGWKAKLGDATLCIVACNSPTGPWLDIFAFVGEHVVSCKPAVSFMQLFTLPSGQMFRVSSYVPQPPPELTPIA